MHRDILAWFANGETGLSSKAMASAAAGIDPTSKSHPCDPADLNRCIKLVDRVPAVRDQFAAIALMSPQWKAVTDNWDLLRETFVREVGKDWSRSKYARKTYEMMKGLGL